MPSYDTQSDPPAPVAQVTLKMNGLTIPDVSLLLDTGADVTLLPKVSAERLGVTPLSELKYELMAFDGSRSLASAVTLDMVFLKRTYRGRFLLIDSVQGVLGRDILQHVTLLFDGPGRAWSEHRS